MKRRITLSIALALSVVLVSLASSDSTAKAQQGGRRFSFDTGVVTLGPNQVLRVTVAAGDVDGADYLTVRFRRMEYMSGACSSDGVCKYTIASQTTSNPIMLAPNESAVVNAGDLVVWRIMVLSNRRNVRVTAAIINTLTGETTSHIIMANTEGDFH